MPYLYGDSSPFPLEENFLETVRDVTDAAVALLRADGVLLAARERAEDAKRDSLKEQSRLEAMAGGVVRALEAPMQDSESPSSARVAGRVLQAARGVLESARGECAHRRDEALRIVEQDQADQRALLPRVLESLLSRRQLPHTVWKLLWRAGIGEDQRARATVTGVAPGGLEATLQLDIPASHLWAQGVKVKNLEPDVVVHLPSEGTLLRKAGLRAEKLGGWYVAEVEVGPERVALVLRESLKSPSDGIELVVRDDHAEAPAARRMIPGGGAVGPFIQLDAIDQRALERLWRKVAETMRDLERRRTTLDKASVDGKPVIMMERPARLAAMLVEAISPLLREIKRRSGAPGELSLKRDLGGGRREELFIAIEDIQRRLDGLTAVQRTLFDTYGLDESGDQLAAALDSIADEDSEVRPLMSAADMSEDAEEEVSDEEATKEAPPRAISKPRTSPPPLPGVASVAQSEDRTDAERQRPNIGVMPRQALN